MRGILEQLLRTPFEEPVVQEDRRTQSLLFDNFHVQSSMRKNAPLELDLAYTRAMMLFLLFHPCPRDILIVGLGGGSLSKYCFHNLSASRITTIEIDDRVIALRDRFVIPADSERFRVIHADASEYLCGKTNVADIILLDGFDAVSLPFSLSTQRFYDDCYAALRHEGVVVANLLDSDAQLEDCLHRIRHACDGKMLRTSVRRERHTIAIGLKQKTVPECQHLYRHAQAITKLMGLDLMRYVKKMERIN